MFKNEEIEARLKALKDEYDAKVAELKQSETLLAEKDSAVKELATAKETLKAAERTVKEAQKKHDDIVARIDKALGKSKKAAKTPVEGTTRGKRGAKGEKVIAVLAPLFPEGLSISELEGKTGEANLGVWFATTGKKTKGIVKLARGTYGYNPEIEPVETPPATTDSRVFDLTAEPLAKADPSKPGK
jgi:hypothetical protein